MESISIMHARVVKSIEELTKERDQINAALPKKCSALQNLLVLKELGESFDHEELIILQREVEQNERRLAQIALAMSGLENKKEEEEKAHKEYEIEKAQKKLKELDLEILRKLRDKAEYLRRVAAIDQKLQIDFAARNENVAELKQFGQEAPIFCAPDDWYAAGKGRAVSGLAPWDVDSGDDGMRYLNTWISRLCKELGKED